MSTSLVVNLSVDDTEISKLKVGQSATVSPSSSSGGSGGNNGPTFNFGGFAPGGFGNRTSNSNSNSSSSNSSSNTATTPTTSTTAKVTSVGAIASASSGVATFPVVVTITGSTSGLYSGATGQATITYKQLTNVVQVPALAVSQSNGQSSVTVSVNGKKTRRVVTTGITSGGQVQITSGLQAGEQVVVAIPTTRRSTSGTGNPPSGGNFTPPGGNFKGFGQ